MWVHLEHPPPSSTTTTALPYRSYVCARVRRLDVTTPKHRPKPPQKPVRPAPLSVPARMQVAQAETQRGGCPYQLVYNWHSTVTMRPTACVPAAGALLLALLSALLSAPSARAALVVTYGHGGSDTQHSTCAPGSADSQGDLVPNTCTCPKDSPSDVPACCWNGGLPNMPTTRAALGVGVVGQYLVAVGGEDGNGNSFKTVEVFDTYAQQWSTQSIPPLRTARNDLSVAAIGSMVYAIGGYESEGSGTLGRPLSRGTTEVLNTDDMNGWSPCANMPTARQQFAVGVVDGSIWAIGGGNCHNQGEPACPDPLNTVESYYPPLDKWTKRPAMPTARSDLGVGVVGTTIYAIGGINHDGNICDVIEAFDTVGQTWSTGLPPMPTQRFAFSVGVVGPTLYVVGGLGQGGDPPVLDCLLGDTVAAFDTLAQKWVTTLPTMSPNPFARLYMGMGVVGDTMYAIGGKPSNFGRACPDSGYSVMGTVYSFEASQLAACLCHCQHGTCDVEPGPTQQHCKPGTCDPNWANPDCADCDAAHYGANCDKSATCQHGNASSGISGTGHCQPSSCDQGWAGIDCDTCSPNWVGTTCSDCDSGHFGASCSNPCTCQHGTNSSGIHGNGTCTTCDAHWSGRPVPPPPPPPPPTPPTPPPTPRTCDDAERDTSTTDCGDACMIESFLENDGLDVDRCKSACLKKLECTAWELVYNWKVPQCFLKRAPAQAHLSSVDGGSWTGGCKADDRVSPSPPPPGAGTNCENCDSTHFGANCSQACSCAHGNASSGINGTGQCQPGTCAPNWVGVDCNDCGTPFFGPNCSKPCTCQHGTNSSGVRGNGTCVTCATGWAGLNCKECDADHYGADCSRTCTCQHGTPSSGTSGTGHCQPGACNDAGHYGADCSRSCTCKHGTPSSGTSGTGHCLPGSCDPGWAGGDCAFEITCKNGAASSGPAGTGHCKPGTCAPNWVGEDCASCDAAHFGAGCSAACLCRHGSNASGVDGNGTCISCDAGYDLAGGRCTLPSKPVPVPLLIGLSCAAIAVVAACACCARDKLRSAHNSPGSGRELGEVTQRKQLQHHYEDDDDDDAEAEDAILVQ